MEQEDSEEVRRATSVDHIVTSAAPPAPASPLFNIIRGAPSACLRDPVLVELASQYNGRRIINDDTSVRLCSETGEMGLALYVAQPVRPLAGRLAGWLALVQGASSYPCLSTHVGSFVIA